MTDPHVNSKCLWQHTQTLHMFKTNVVHALRGVSRHKITFLLSRRYLQLIPTCKGKISFLQWDLTVYSNHISGQVLCNKVNTKWWCFYRLLSHFFVLFSSIGLLSVCFLNLCFCSACVYMYFLYFFLYFYFNLACFIVCLIKIEKKWQGRR